MLKLIRLRDVREITQRSTSRIYHDMNAGTFPRPIRIGIRAVAWLEGDIQDWLSNRISERNMRGAV